MKVRAWFAIILLVIPILCFAEEDIDRDLNRRVHYKRSELLKAREALDLANKVGVQPRIQALYEKFDRNDLPRTRQNAYSLERIINPSYFDFIKIEVICEGFIRVDFNYPAGTDTYAVQKYVREWSQYIGQNGFDCFVYFLGSVGRLKVCGYEYDPLESKVSVFK